MELRAHPALQPGPLSSLWGPSESHWGKGVYFLGEEARRHGEGSVRGLRQWGFAVLIPALSLPSACVTLDLRPASNLGRPQCSVLDGCEDELR